MLSRCQLFATAWTVVCQAPLSTGFSRQEYWSGLPFPSPGNLSNPGTERRSPPLQADTLPTELRRKPQGRGTRDQIANIHWIIEKARESQKNIYFCFIDYAKALDCVDHNKLWKTIKEMGIPDHLICLLRNLYAGQEAKVRTGHGTTDWFQIGKGVHQDCTLPP